MKLRTTLAGLLLATTLHAQSNDSLRTEYSVEMVDLSRQRMQEAFQYITRAHVEEKTLIKVGASLPLPAWGGAIGLMGGIGTEFGLERKLTPSFSVQALMTGQIYRNGDIATHYSASVPVSLRYYYAMARRIRNGRGANNFSGNYLGLQVNNTLFGNQHYDQLYFSGGVYGTRRANAYSGFELASSVALQWGLQRRIGRRGYLEANFTVPIHPILTQRRIPRYFAPFGVTVKVGLGW